MVRTDVNGSIAMSVRGTVDASGGAPVYELYMGAETVRRTAAAVGNDTIKLTWQEIVILGCIVIFIALIVYPAVQQARKSAKAAARGAGKKSNGRSRK